MSKISITIDGETIEEVRANMVDMLGRLGESTSTQVATDAPVTPAAAPVVAEQKIAPTPTPAAAPATAPAAKQADEGDNAVDADGMPYNPDVHAATRSLTADGLWKAQRGKASEAKAARAAFKAQGAGQAAPTLPTAEPETKTAASLPGAENLPSSEPVTLQEMVSIIEKAIADGVTDVPSVVKMYGQVTGQPNPTDAFKTFKINETSRSAMVDAIEVLYG